MTRWHWRQLCSSVEEKKISLCAELCFHASPSYSGLFSSTIQILALWWASLFKGRKFPLCDGEGARVRMHRRIPHLFLSLPWVKQWQNTWKRHSSGPSDGPCVRPRLFPLWPTSASCVDAAGTSSMQLHSPTLEDVREEEGLIWRGDIWGFLSETWKSTCARGHAALWGLSVLALYLRGMYEYLINKSQAQGRCREGAAASQNPSWAHPQAYNMPSC